MMRINVWAPFFLARACHPLMVARGGGVIINVGSATGVRATVSSVSYPSYAPSKAALGNLSDLLAKAWAADGIRVMCIAPGLLRSEMTREITARLDAAGDGYTPLGRIGDAEEVAGMALILASAAGAYITGGTYTVDGGGLIRGLRAPRAGGKGDMGGRGGGARSAWTRRARMASILSAAAGRCGPKPWLRLQPRPSSAWTVAVLFDTFGDDLGLEVVGEGDDHADDIELIVAAGEAGDEGAVDLEVVNLELAQVLEAGVAGTEVVQGDADALDAEAAEVEGGAGGVLGDGGFGDLKTSRVGGGGRRRLRVRGGKARRAGPIGPTDGE